MPSFCVYNKCRNNSNTCPELSFFGFPVNPPSWAVEAYERLKTGSSQYEDWLLRCGANKDFWDLPLHKLKQRKLCATHFHAKDFMNERKNKLKPLAVPVHHGGGAISADMSLEEDLQNYKQVKPTSGVKKLKKELNKFECQRSNVENRPPTSGNYKTLKTVTDPKEEPYLENMKEDITEDLSSKTELEPGEIIGYFGQPSHTVTQIPPTSAGLVPKEEVDAFQWPNVCVKQEYPTEGEQSHTAIQPALDVEAEYPQWVNVSIKEECIVEGYNDGVKIEDNIDHANKEDCTCMPTGQDETEWTQRENNFMVSNENSDIIEPQQSHSANTGGTTQDGDISDDGGVKLEDEENKEANTRDRVASNLRVRNSRKARIIALWFLHRRHKQRRRKRSLWVHPINQSRSEVGIFNTLYEELRQDQDKFFNYFRMSIGSFDELHRKLQSAITRKNTQMRNCIPSVERLALALRYFASGSTFTDLHYSFRMGVSTIKCIVEEVSTAIWAVMKEECMPQLTKGKLEDVALGFEKNAQFPHCLGAVGGKYIRSGSVVVLAVVDADYRFIYVHVGSYGKECDSSIFKDTNLWKAIQCNMLELPEEKCLPGSEHPKVPYFFAADEAFGLNTSLMRPFGGTHLTLQKKIFNYRLSRASRHMECAFAILSNKWHIFHRPLHVEPQFAVKIVKASLLLHNFVRERDGYLPEDAMTIIGLEDLPREDKARGGLEANDTRKILSDYFLTSVGAVPWQMTKI